MPTKGGLSLMSVIQRRAVWSFLVALALSLITLLLIRVLSPSNSLQLRAGSVGIIFAGFSGYNVAMFPFNERQRLLRLAIFLNPVCGLAAASLSLLLWDYVGLFLSMVFVMAAVLALLSSFGIFIAYLQASATSKVNGGSK